MIKYNYNYFGKIGSVTPWWYWSHFVFARSAQEILSCFFVEKGWFMTSKTAIKVYCSPEEKNQVQALAEKYNVSCSHLLLSTAMHYQLLSRTDEETVKQLSKLSGILGKHVGMLKQLLSVYDTKDFTRKELRRELSESKETRELILKFTQDLLNKWLQKKLLKIQQLKEALMD